MRLFNGSETRILVIAAHADDEVLGACGYLFLALQAGASVHIAILSTDSSSRDINDDTKNNLKNRRIAAARNNAKLMGWTLSLYDYPDNSFDTVGFLNIAKTIEREIADFNPTILLTHFPGDISKDHQIVSSAAITATRPLALHSPATILFFEICSSTHWWFGLPNNSFTPNLWVPLGTDAWQAKVQAIQSYADELREWPHPRSLDGIHVQAKYRGSEIGINMAEAFIIARTIATVAQ